MPSFWVGPALGGLWTTAANWSGGVPNASGAIAFIDTPDLPTPTNYGLIIPTASTIRIGTLDMLVGANTNYAISAASGTATEIVFDNGASSAVLNFNVIPGGGPLTFRAPNGLRIRLDSDLAINVAASTVNLWVPISGVGGIDKSGAGELYMTGPGTFTGGVTLRGGTITTTGTASLGSNDVIISNNAVLRNVGNSFTLDNVISTVSGATGVAGSAQILAATGTTLTLGRRIDHLSTGTITFGSTTHNGAVILDLIQTSRPSAGASYRLAGGTVKIDSALSSDLFYNNLLPLNATKTTIDTGATLDTNGWAMTISNLDMDGGTIRSSSGRLMVNVRDNALTTVAQSGTIIGTALNDFFTVAVTTTFSLFGVTFNSWSANDLITLNGSSADNNIRGSIYADRINGGDGNDTLSGSAGVDIINGDIGNDLIILADDNGGSLVDGGAGTDVLRLINGSITLGAIGGFEELEILNNATLTLTGAQFASGFGLFSTLDGNGIVTVNLDAGNNIMNARGMNALTGTNVRFIVNGSSGSDSVKVAINTASTINGAAGNDVLVGSDRPDIINGGSEIDKIRGGGASDTLNGGSGADVFKFRNASDSGIGANADIITDFVSGEDKLNFRRIDTDPVTPGTQGFAYIGTAAFGASGAAQVRYVDLGADLRVEADVNGDGIADMHILLQGAGAQTLTAADFLL